MKTIFGILLASGIMALAPLAGAQDEHSHDHGTPAAKASPPKPGGKFESDKPLRTHMGSIRNDIQGQMKAVHQKSIKAADYEKLSGKIDKTVKSIFKECKLKPEADAALHSILADIMAGSSTMKTGELDARLDGYLKVIQGLEEYARTFTDPTWKPIEH